MDSISGKKKATGDPLPLTEEAWKKELTKEEFHVLRQKGTEAPFTGEYWDSTGDGEYACRACGTPLFGSGEKFQAHCGWPSFSLPKSAQAVEEHTDKTHGMIRTEVTCRNCGSHLGHVFNDGPPPTGLRYCINSVSITFIPRRAPL